MRHQSYDAIMVGRSAAAQKRTAHLNYFTFAANKKVYEVSYRKIERKLTGLTADFMHGLHGVDFCVKT